MQKTHIVIVGGGFGGVYALKRLHKMFHSDPSVRVTLVGENNYFLFTPLLHEVATGSVSPENIVEPIRKILGCCLDDFYLGKVTRLDMEKRSVETTAGNLAYDYLVLAAGAETNFYNIPGAEEHSLTLKSLSDAVRIKNRCIDLVERASHVTDRNARKKMLSFAVIGGGPTGVELAAELQEFLKETFSRYYRKEIIDDVSVSLVQRDIELLPQFPKPLRERSLKVLKKKGIEVLLKVAVSRVGEDEVEFTDGRTLHAETVIWVAGIKPVRLPFAAAALSLSSLADGRIKVNTYLQTEGRPEVFAIGDMAAIETAPGATVPALAQAAVKEAGIVAENIARHRRGIALLPFKYKSRGMFVSLGKWKAVGQISVFFSVFSLFLSGYFAWWLWRTIYLSKLISWQKKFKVAVDWTVNAFSSRDISEL